MMKQKKERKKKTPAREILEWVLTFAVAVAIALPVRAFGFQLVRVDGSSMDNTLANGEIMFVPGRMMKQRKKPPVSRLAEIRSALTL